MIARESLEKVRLRDSDPRNKENVTTELTEFLNGGGKLVPSGSEIIGAIDASVVVRCNNCLPAAAHAISYLSNWVGIGRLTPDQAAVIVNEQNVCGHLGLVAVAS
jgi:hypothetical protein